jgi:hypothetical protein
LHRNTAVTSSIERWLSPKEITSFLTQQRNKYLLETLEPEAMDSFSIGIFRHYVTAKEGYSDYVFEDSATTILKENPKLKTEFFEQNRVPNS